jgi:hypothetical protein
MGSFSGLVFLQKVPADASRIGTKRFVERLTVTVRCAESLAVHSATRDIPGRLGLLR